VRDEDVLRRLERRVDRLALLVLEAHVVDGALPANALE
jgi:hypothetical protein